MNQSPDFAHSIVTTLLPDAHQKMNKFSSEILKTRGGRIGSGMGSLLEALWGFMMNQTLVENGYNLEIAWFPDNQYNDFACLVKDADWNVTDRSGEVFRIEAKSMNTGADESKAHFDVLQSELFDFDSLLILIWEWRQTDSRYYSPQVIDTFFNRSLPIAYLRDKLHEARGGTFVNKNNCPDKCLLSECTHGGEPLNANGKRERISGPESRRPSQKSSFAANFGGLVRMLKTNSPEARQIFRDIRSTDDIADEYISFIHRNFPSEELSQYSAKELADTVRELGIGYKHQSKQDLMDVLKKHPNHMKILRELTT